jgi:hypothetical protein
MVYLTTLSGRKLLPTSLSTFKVEAVGFSETMVAPHPSESILHICCSEIPKLTNVMWDLRFP